MKRSRLSTQVLLGGEEFYLGPTPERDALLSALCLVEAVTEGGQDLSALYRALQEREGFSSVYQRRDLHLADQKPTNPAIPTIAGGSPV